MATKTKAAKKRTSSIVWFQIPADDVTRAKRFYGSLFGWKINPFPNSPPEEHEYISLDAVRTEIARCGSCHPDPENKS